jgi:hypothetical protein
MLPFAGVDALRGQCLWAFRTGGPFEALTSILVLSKSMLFDVLFT